MELRDLVKDILFEYITIIATDSGERIPLGHMINIITEKIENKFIIQKKYIDLKVINKIDKCEFQDYCTIFLLHGKCNPKCKKQMKKIKKEIQD